MGEYKYDADICRERGWGVGTRLIADEDMRPFVIEITAMGLKHVLAALVERDGTIHASSEGYWSLQWREWREVEPAGSARKERGNEST